MRKLLFLCLLFFSFPVQADGPDKGELFGITLGAAIGLDQFVDHKIYRPSPNSSLYSLINSTSKSLKLNNKMTFFGIKRASANFDLDSFKVESISAQSEYESWEEAQRQAQFICEHFSKNYGGECKDVLQLDPEELLKNSLWPVEIYYNDFGRTYALSLHVGRRHIPGTQGEIENSFSIGFEIFRDRYKQCLDYYNEPDDWGLNEGRDPYIECADLKR